MCISHLLLCVAFKSGLSTQCFKAERVKVITVLTMRKLLRLEVFKKQYGQYTYNGTLKSVSVTNVAVEKQLLLHIFACVRVWVRVCKRACLRACGHPGAWECV